MQLGKGDSGKLLISFQEKLRLLYEISHAVTSDRYLGEVLEMVVGLTARVLGLKICSLMVLDAPSQTLKIKATQSLSRAYRLKPPLNVAGSVSGRAVLQKRPVMVKNVQKEKEYQHPEIAKKEGLKSLICVPLLVKGRVLGVLNCYSTNMREFSEDEIELLLSVGSQTALAIDYAEVSQEKKTAIEALETRKLIERAKNIIMKRQQINEEDAHRMLQKQSMDQRCSMREIAQSVLFHEEAGSAYEEMTKRRKGMK